MKSPAVASSEESVSEDRSACCASLESSDDEIRLKNITSSGSEHSSDAAPNSVTEVKKTIRLAGTRRTTLRFGRHSKWSSSYRSPRKKSRCRVVRRPRKVVVVGDSGCGKSALVMAYCHDRYPEEHEPTILKSVPADAEVDGEKIDLVVIDTPGEEEYAPIRPCVYRKTDLVVICFSVDSPRSMENVRRLWVPEIQRCAVGVPYILVGNKTDIRDDYYANHCHCSVCQECALGCGRGWDAFGSRQSVLDCSVSSKRGQELAKQAGCLDYMECSAKYRSGTRDVFETAAYYAVKRHKRKRRRQSRGPEACVIL